MALLFLFAPQGIKRRKRERMVFDKNTQVCKITFLYIYCRLTC